MNQPIMETHIIAAYSLWTSITLSENNWGKNLDVFVVLELGEVPEIIEDISVVQNRWGNTPTVL